MTTHRSIGFRHAQARRPQGLHDREEEKPDRFAEGRPAEKLELPMARDVRVEVVRSEERVVLHVVALEEHRRRRAVGKAGEDAGQRVLPRCLEDQVVRDLVNDDPQGVIRERPDRDREQPDEPPGARTHPGRDHGLDGHDAERDPERPGVLADEVADFGMLLDDGSGPAAMGVGALGLQEIRGRGSSGSLLGFEHHKYPSASLIRFLESSTINLDSKPRADSDPEKS